ncbi:MAG: hypothetical protein NVSMB65_06520 [Chloroflexota bacterium]
MIKLFFSVLAGYAIFIGLMMFQIIMPLINGIDAQLGGNALRVVVPAGSPVPDVVTQMIDEHPQLILRVCEGAVVVLLSWSLMLLLTHWARGIRAALSRYQRQRALAASRHLATLATKKRDNWN